MGGLSIWHWVVVVVLLGLLFGRGRVSSVLGDIGKGIRTLRKEMSDDGAAVPPLSLRDDRSVD